MIDSYFRCGLCGDDLKEIPLQVVAYTARGPTYVNSCSSCLRGLILSPPPRSGLLSSIRKRFRGN